MTWHDEALFPFDLIAGKKAIGGFNDETSLLQSHLALVSTCTTSTSKVIRPSNDVQGRMKFQELPIFPIFAVLVGSPDFLYPWDPLGPLGLVSHLAFHLDLKPSFLERIFG